MFSVFVCPESMCAVVMATCLSHCSENKPPNKAEQEKPDERKVKFVAKDLLNVSGGRSSALVGVV